MASHTSSEHGSEDAWTDRGFELDEERVQNFRAMGLHVETLVAFAHHGYRVWFSQDGGSIAHTNEEVWRSLGISMGDQDRLRIGLRRYHAGTFHNHYNLPGGSLFYGQGQPIPPPAAAPADPQQTPTAGNPFQERLNTLNQFIDDAIGALVTPESVQFVKNILFPLLCILALGFAIAMLISGPVVVSATATATATVATVDCLDGESKITTAKRELVPIRKIEPNSFVLSYFKGKFRIVRVLEVTRSTVPAANVCQIQLANSESIMATRDHPFFCNIDQRGKGKWCAASPDSAKIEKLTPGHVLVGVQGEQVPVAAIKSCGHGGTREVFNLILEGQGTFFVNNVLCHSGTWIKSTQKENRMTVNRDFGNTKV